MGTSESNLANSTLAGKLGGWSLALLAPGRQWCGYLHPLCDSGGGGWGLHSSWDPILINQIINTNTTV